MKVGIVGFRGSGKSTVFNTLTGLGSRRPKKVKRTRVATVTVPDPRLEQLARILELKEIAHLEISLIDFTPGKGERALNPRTFKQLAEVDVLALVIKRFSSPSQQSEQSPTHIIEDFESELKLTDLVAMEKWITQLKKADSPVRELELLTRCRAHLEEEGPLRDISLHKEERTWLDRFGFISLKPLMVVLNLGLNEAARPMPKELTRYLKKRGLPVVPICAKAEIELVGMDEAAHLKRLTETGLQQPASQRFIQSCFDKLMKLTSFLSYDQKQVRAWSVKQGTTARQAVLALHPGREHEIIGFELVRYDDLVECGDESKARGAGKFKKPANGYVVREGDIVLPIFGERE